MVDDECKEVVSVESMLRWSNGDHSDQESRTMILYLSNDALHLLGKAFVINYWYLLLRHPAYLEEALALIVKLKKCV